MNIFNKIFLIFTVSCLTAHSQNINNIFPDFDKTGMKSSILYNPAGVSNIINLKNKKNVKKMWSGFTAEYCLSKAVQREAGTESSRNLT